MESSSRNESLRNFVKVKRTRIWRLQRSLKLEEGLVNSKVTLTSNSQNESLSGCVKLRRMRIYCHPERLQVVTAEEGHAKRNLKLRSIYQSGSLRSSVKLKKRRSHCRKSPEVAKGEEGHEKLNPTVKSCQSRPPAQQRSSQAETSLYNTVKKRPDSHSS
jgi:hypothetical protein